MKLRTLMLQGFVLALAAVAAVGQQPTRQKPAPQPNDRNQPATTAQATKPAPAKPEPKDYKAGETYSLGDVIKLSDDDRLTAEIDAQAGLLAVKVAISGKMHFLGFTFGQEDSDVVLVLEGKRLPALGAEFTPEVVASVSGPTLFTHMRSRTAKGTLVLDTNEHPVVFVFSVPKESEKATKRLELNGVRLGDKDYSLSISLEK